MSYRARRCRRTCPRRNRRTGGGPSASGLLNSWPIELLEHSDRLAVCSCGMGVRAKARGLTKAPFVYRPRRLRGAASDGAWVVGRRCAKGPGDFARGCHGARGALTESLGPTGPRRIKKKASDPQCDSAGSPGRGFPRAPHPVRQCGLEPVLKQVGLGGRA